MRPTRILVPTDFSEASRTALRRAAVSARAWDAELHLLHVTWSGADDPYSLAWADGGREAREEELRETLRDEMRVMVEELGDGVTSAEPHLLEGPAPAPLICDFATSRGVDLIVMGAHGRRGWRRLLLGSVTEEVVRTAPCNVLCLHRQPREGTGLLHRIVVPIDFTDSSRRALATAEAMATEPRTVLDLVHVVEHPVVPQYFDPFDAEPASRVSAEILRRVEEELSRWAEEATGPDVECRIEILQGPVARRIAEHAEDADSDLIVISTHGHTGVQHLLLGSVTERLVRLSDRPVLVVRSPAESPEGEA